MTNIDDQARFERRLGCGYKLAMFGVIFPVVLGIVVFVALLLLLR